MSAPEFDVETVVQFIAMLEPEEFDTHQFCWFRKHDSEEGGARNVFSAFDADLAAGLRQRNAQGFGVFLAVNAIAPGSEQRESKWGSPYVAETRKASQVRRIRAVFGDFDNPQVPLPVFDLAPSIVVQTSPGKHHVYWLLDSAGPLPIEEFDTIQRGIIETYSASGADKSMLAPNHVLRLPGSLHMKGEPHLVRIVAAPGHHYTAQQLRDAFPQATPTRSKVDMPWDGRMSPEMALVVQQIDEWWGPPRVSDGAYVIDCPWSDQHTSGKSKTETVYWRPHADNGGKGWFRCLHSHCSERYADEFHRVVQAHLQGAKA